MSGKLQMSDCDKTKSSDTMFAGVRLLDTQPRD
jgi:hypothetical protein